MSEAASSMVRQGVAAVGAREEGRCPLCGSERHITRFHGEGFRVVKCRDCGLAYSDAASASIDAQETEFNGEIEPEQPHIQRRVQDILRYVPRGQALDIGCGRGEVSILLSRHGFTCEGIDTGRGVIEHLRRAHPEVTWHCGRAEEFLSEARSFDVVTMYHVLEHVEQPVRMMELAARAVRRGGLIVVEVPNAGGLQARLRGRAWDYMKEDHLNYFGARQLVRLGRRVGCAVLAGKGFYHFSYPQNVWWKDWVKGVLCHVGFRDVISVFFRVERGGDG